MQRGGGQTIDEGLAITVDGFDNSYTTGYITTSARFESNTIFSAGLEDIFIIKNDKFGSVKWAKRAGGITSDKALAIDADSIGNVMITGFFTGSATFDTQTIFSSGQRDIFIAKYDPSGNLIWVIQAGGPGDDIGNDVSFDKSGNVLVTGEFSGTSLFGSTSISSLNNSIDIFTAKYDSFGNFLWVKSGAAKYTDRGTSIDTDDNNNIYVSGMFSDTITFDNTYNNTIFNAMFLIKYNSAGSEQWVRWMGSGNSVNMGGIAVYKNDINLTGNFRGTLFFLGGTNTLALTSPDPNNIFVCRYDVNGNLTWNHADGSINDVSAEDVSTNSNGEISITGNFKCRFSSFSRIYGDGVFCSVGYTDNYVSSYDNNGDWMWARHSGGKQNEFASGITVLSNKQIVTTGSFQDGLNMPIDTTRNYQLGTVNLDYRYLEYNSQSYCRDSTYGLFNQLLSQGNYDIYINGNYDLLRQPYDFFKRNDTLCNRIFNDVCIEENNLVSCPDTVKACDKTQLHVLLTNNLASPDYNFLWNTGSLLSEIQATSTGNYIVTVTSADGCFVNQDSIYFIVEPLPDVPLISDSKGINSNALSTNIISFCRPDSVTLTCTNLGTNSIQWSGFPIGKNPITTHYSGGYYANVTNQFGCVNFNTVVVEADSAFKPIQLKIRSLNDLDLNDTIILCNNESFEMLLYDRLTDSLGIGTSLCYPGMMNAHWRSDSSFFYNLTSYCSNNQLSNTFSTKDTGTFSIIIEAWIIRENFCDTDSVYCSIPLTIIVHELPIGAINLNVSGPGAICQGDSAMLIVTPSTYSYTWNNGSTNDTIIIFNSGYYSVSTKDSITNSFGCKAELSGVSGILISGYPQPIITLGTSSGLICPNDSVQLICSGSGSCSWQSPNGVLADTSLSTYVNTSGNYYCIQTVGTGCQLVSNTIQVYQYNSPFIYALPATTICKNESIILSVVSGNGSTIQWLPPFTGNASNQVVTTAGTYNCIVNSCQIISPLSITINVDSAFAEIHTDNNLFSFCEGDTITLHANFGMNKYLWLPGGDTTLLYLSSQPGNISLFTTSVYGCKDSANINVTSIPNTVLSPMIEDRSICVGDTVLFQIENSNVIHWSLSADYNHSIFLGNTFQTLPLQHPQTYYFYVDSGECKSPIGIVNILIKEDCKLNSIPNIFTPNNDGVNDDFPGFYGLKEVKLTILNRWGKIIFESNKTTEGWAGTNNKDEPVPEGTYYYLLIGTYPDGSKVDKKGFITLIR
jgi:gliding motility-associated-like protein